MRKYIIAMLLLAVASVSAQTRLPLPNLHGRQGRVVKPDGTIGGFRLAEYDTTYSCVHDSLRTLLFPSGHEGFQNFYSKLATLINTGNGRVNILHIGGSHVQGGSLSHTIRTALTNMTDGVVGDRGMLFPFSAIRTEQPNAAYKFTYEGKWDRSRCVSATPDAILGLSGAAAMTTSPTNSVTLNMSESKWAFTRLRLLGESANGTAVPYVILNGQEIEASKRDNLGFVFELPYPTTTFTIKFRGLESDRFTLRGFLPESDRQGITYTASGIIGAAVPSWLRCPKFEEELGLIPPDLVIFGIGINDASSQRFSPETFKNNYRTLIRRIQKVNPDCAFLFITNNDCYFDKPRTFNTNTPIVEQAFKELAEEYKGCVFNVFRIMGGMRSSQEWCNNKLMWGDHVHFTTAGYRIVGSLLANALIEDFQSY